MNSSSPLPADRRLKLAAWASLVLAIACWPLALYFLGLVMGESPAVHEATEIKRDWTPAFFGTLLFSFLASTWFSGLSIRRAPLVAGFAIAINAVAMGGVLAWSAGP